MIFIILLTLITLIISGITTIPFVIGLLTIQTVLFKKSWVFFLALGLGLFLDLIMIRPLGYTSLVLAIFVFLIRLYERKFETQTIAFVFISTFLGSLIYLMIFGYNNVLIQSLISAIIGVLFFKLLWLKLGLHSETI
ncbi:MAG: hypothetical protein A3B47_03695 [Candidatus Levybacteria bacterium RIFCSPLOWO2_01_FULL_39_24]|nr:MAG: hypothetical protein A2800_03500 [Candidatus Levybacteria bacterium RIFCSPHIGHO2_01_FULL_40_16]OGH28156.1 MAG: hypothetical protein A3E12_04200 [Candidatus Levybacteria bacterium RIFCSPHIGHO2_12_FULL_39_9]OGH46343.1 MAG: hypothetical protein A3B47_03695 [Candidatus Levybacteria bacterium RIFCSPLOWO2_01_FULL_39_24]